MDDEQIAARRAEISVHCAACGGEYPGTTELHNGICDACHKLTHGPNYRLIAELNRKAEEVVRLKLEVAHWRTNHDQQVALKQRGHERYQALRTALEEIRDGVFSGNQASAWAAKALRPGRRLHDVDAPNLNSPTPSDRP